MYMIINLERYGNVNSVFKRISSRAIITQNDKYLFVFSKHGDYMFPGGGLEEGESLEDALVREVREETGYGVYIDSIKKYGKALERIKVRFGGVAQIESHYFFCDIKSKIKKRKLNDYEREYDYKEVWLSLSEAIKRNKKIKDTDICPWVIRETRVMERLKNEI